jgi:hypothetical protein
MAYVPTTTHVTLLATLQRERLLPAPGEVGVQENQRVDATTVLAQATVAKHHRLVDIAGGLGVPAKQIEAFLVKHEGDPVKKDDPLATRRELFLPRDVFCPIDGTVIAVGDGKALIAGVEPPIEIRAGMPATVTKVVTDYGANLETVGALLEGVWGNGQEAFGVLRVVGTGLADPLASELIDVELRGTVVAVGTLRDAAALNQLAEINAKALVVGSVYSELVPELQKLAMPVLVVEGFGAQGFSQPAYTLLASNTGREAWVNAQAWDRYAGRRPEVIIPLPSPSQAPGVPANGEALKTGQRVRIVRGPGAGYVGQAIALSDDVLFTASGVRTRLATVKLEESADPPILVPFANLEILE